jgi:flagellar hook protein FlgE
MLGAIYIGLSGMNAYGRGLQTISNNVANLNSTGFKSSTAAFSDVFSFGGGGITSFRSLDGMLGGSGVRYSDSRISFAQGDLRQSTGDLDLGIQGSGFLVLLRGDKTYFARTGQFAVDKDGYITLQGSDYRLGVLDGSGRAVALNVNTKKSFSAKATTQIKFSDNLSSGATSATISNMTVYDSRGQVQNWTVQFDKVAGAVDEWDVKVTNGAGTVLKTEKLKFSGSNVDPTTTTIVVTDSPSGADPLSVTLDFSSGVTSFSTGTSSTLRYSSIDGNASGVFSSATIDADGKVKISYSNGQTELAGAVALADFRDPQQLQRLGGGIFENLGDAPTRLLSSNQDGAGRLLSKQLEASNVDLSQQFGDLILIQRGYQASSQVVSIANDMIQELFGIRGRG